MKDQINIAIVDDEELIVVLLKDFLSHDQEINILFTALSGDEFLDKTRSAEKLPDVVLMDLRMKGKDGIDTCVELKEEFPDVKVITISSFYKKSFMGYMMRSGVSAFIPKSISPIDLVGVIKDVYYKGFYFMPEQIDIMRDQISKKVPQPVYQQQQDVALSQREIDVLKLICEELTAVEIADKLCVAKRTVDGHRNNLLSKTGAKNTAGLVMYAMKNGIVTIKQDKFI